MRRPISCPAALWRHSLPGRRSRPRQKGAARSKEAEQLGTAAHRQPFPPGPSGPLTGWVPSSDTEQLPLSGLADSSLPVCRTVAGKGWKGLAERAEQGDASG